MSNYIHGHSIVKLREEYQRLLKENPHQTEIQIQGLMIGKYSLTHDDQGRIIAISLEEVFRDDPSDQLSSN